MSKNNRRDDRNHNADETGNQTGLRRLLTRKEAAQILGVSERTLWTLTEKGIIPAVPIGRLVRYDTDDLRRAIEAMKSGGKAVTHC